MHHFEYPRGRIIAHGFFYDSNVAIDIIKQNVLELWSPGASLYKTDLGFAFILPEAKPYFIEELSCYPLLKQHGGLSNVIWPDEIELPSRKYANSLWLAQYGIGVELNLSIDNQFDPSIWVDLDPFEEKPMNTLGNIKKPRLKETKSNRSARSVLKDKTLEESNELKEVLGHLNDIKQTGSVSKQAKVGNNNSLFSKLQSIFNLGKSEAAERNSHGTAGTKDSRGYSNHSPQAGGLLSKFKANISNLLMASALGKVIGRAQAKYIRNLMEQLHKGDIETALRHAIPLSNLQDAMQARQAAMGSLDSRMSLNINPYSKGPASSVSLDEEVTNRLRQMYENAFSQMDKQGNYKKAAFILAELLRDIDRAVEYLEKHQQLTLAAELAEGQNLSPARVIRQWIIAGDVKRAIQVAIISGCYEEAITALEGKNQKEANMLRWHIAQLHFQAGDIGSAIDIAWPLTEKRKRVVDWLKESYQLGGALGARHLVRLALNDVDNFNDYLEKINHLFLNQSKHCSYSIIDEILKSDDSVFNKRIASIISRAYLLSVSSGKIQHDSKRWNQLCMLSGDLTLRADTRNLSFNSIEKKVLLKSTSTALEFHFDEAHGRRVADVAVLSNQCYLIAFGESGLELWNAKGRKLQSFSVPCHSIVVSDSGTHVLLVAARSGYQVVSKFDIKTLRVQHWLDVNLSCWSDTYDGIRWMVAYENAVVALDTSTEQQQTVLWRVGDLSGSVQSIIRSSSYFSFCLSTSESFELWTYRLPNLYLKQRTPYKTQHLNDIVPVAYDESGYITGLNPENNNQFSVYQENISKHWTELGFESEITGLKIFADFLLAQTTLDDSASVHLFPLAGHQIQDRVMSLHFAGNGEQIIRMQGVNLLIVHSDGRFVHIGTHYGEIEAEFIV